MRCGKVRVDRHGTLQLFSGTFVASVIEIQHCRPEAGVRAQALLTQRIDGFEQSACL